MANKLHDAVTAALRDAQVSGAIAEIVQKAVQESTLEAVKKAVLGANQANYDPYRTTIHFLIALIAFCLSVIVGIFNALPDPPVCTYTLTYRMLGGVLAWISITALIATFCAGFAQLRKSYLREHPKKSDGTDSTPWKGERAALMLIPALFGTMTVIYCVGVGLSILNNNLGPLKSASVICKLWPF